MTTRRTNARRGSKSAAPAKTTRSTTKEAAAKAKAAAGRDVTQYADKAPTEFHKFFARWITEQVGYSPEDAKTKRGAFLMGVSISTAARQAFTASQELADWREETGEQKRGPKSSATETARSKKAREAEVEEDEDEDEDEELSELEAELREMAMGPLRKVAKEEYELSLKRGMTKDDIIDAILEVAEEDDDDDEDEDEEGIDLDELEEELTGLTLAKVKARAKEFDITPKRGESKEDLIERILESLESEEDEDEDEDEEEDEKPAKSSRAKGKAKPADDDDEDEDDEYVF